MNSFRFSGSDTVETCSPETTVPWITSTSSPASSASSWYFNTRCGVSDAATTTFCSLISLIRWAISSGFTGSA